MAGAAPWGRRDLAVWALLTLAGCALLLVAWNGASNEVRFEDTMVWLQLSIWGVVVALLGDTFWFLAGRRSVRRLRRSLLEATRPTTRPATAQAAAAAGGLAVAATGMKHYHRPGCQLAQGKAVDPAAVADHQSAGRVPCGMCRP